jgi:hypothetical protein
MSKSKYQILKDKGNPKHHGPNMGNSLMYLFSRAAMRNPSPEVRITLEMLHGEVSKKFSSMSDEALNWLIGGYSGYSRGGILQARELRNFLTQEPKNIESSHLIMQLESILTAIGYRSFNANFVEPPFKPETNEQLKCSKTINKIMQGQMVKTVGSLYPGKFKDKTPIYINDHKTTTQDISASMISDASVANLDIRQPLKKTPDTFFRNYNEEDGSPTWIKQAKDQNIPVVAHVSGTSTIAMSAFYGLMKNKIDSFSNINEDHVFFSILLGPQYLRSRYHSLAETSAGIRYFLEKRHELTPVKMSPLEAEENICGYLAEGVSSAKSIEDECSLSDAIMQISEEYYNDIKDIENPDIALSDLQKSLLYCKKCGFKTYDMWFSLKEKTNLIELLSIMNDDSPRINNHTLSFITDKLSDLELISLRNSSSLRKAFFTLGNTGLLNTSDLASIKDNVLLQMELVKKSEVYQYQQMQGNLLDFKNISNKGIKNDIKKEVANKFIQNMNAVSKAYLVNDEDTYRNNLNEAKTNLNELNQHQHAGRRLAATIVLSATGIFAAAGLIQGCIQKVRGKQFEYLFMGQATKSAQSAKKIMSSCPSL